MPTCGLPVILGLCPKMKYHRLSRWIIILYVDPDQPVKRLFLFKIAHEEGEDVGLEFDEKDVLGEIIRADAAVAAT